MKPGILLPLFMPIPMKTICYLCFFAITLVHSHSQQSGTASVAERSGNASPAQVTSTHRWLEGALTAATLVKDDRFRADGLRAEVARVAMQSEQLPMAAKALSGMNPNDYRFPLLCAEWVLRGGEATSLDSPHLTIEHAWNLAVTLAPRRRAEALTAIKAGFPEFADRPIPTAGSIASGAIAAEVAGFRFFCLRLLMNGKFPGKPEWEKALQMTKAEKFSMDPDGLLLTDCLVEMGLEIIRRDAGENLAKLGETIEASLTTSNVPSIPQGLGYAQWLIAAGEKEKALGLMAGLSGTLSRITARNPTRTEFESRLVLLEILAGMPEKASNRASGLPAQLDAQMDYEQFFHAGDVLAALLASGQDEDAAKCLQRLTGLAEKNDNANNLQFLRGNAALAIARSEHVTKVSQSGAPGFDTLMGHP